MEQRETMKRIKALEQTVEKKKRKNSSASHSSSSSSTAHEKNIEELLLGLCEDELSARSSKRR